jgi:HSP20 family protein
MKSILKGLFLYECDHGDWPLTDLYETDEYLIFEVDVPGIEPENLSVKIYENFLVIEGQRQEEDSDAQGINYICMERGASRFKRLFKIPVSVNVMDGEAFYEMGVLTVRIPKLKGKLIEIEVKRKNPPSAE